MFKAEFKLEFFAPERVTDPAERAKVREMSRFGAYVRAAAKKSIKTKPGPSPRGTPPHAHTSYESQRVNKRTGKRQVRYVFRDSILFGHDRAADAVFVGPVFRAGARTRPTMPEAQEFGGTVTTRFRSGKAKTGRLPPRPFMAPALEKELPKFAGLFRGSIGG